MKIWLYVGSAVALVLLGWWLGTNHVEGKWAKADNRALQEQKRLYDEAIAKRDALQQTVTANETRLAEMEQAALALSRRLQEEINREPVVKTVVKEVEGECEWAIPDADAHWLRWNEGIGQAYGTVLPAIEADDSDGELRATRQAAGLDADG